jgi:4-hydroxy-tetrahydrodipicolinate synthase
VCPVIATPFTETGAIDYESLRNEVKVLAEGGCHAGVLFGVVSEFFKLTDEERGEMVDVVVDEAHQYDMPVVISVTHEATEVAVEWAQEYEQAGADYLMVFLPSFLEPPASALSDHLEAIGEALSTPIMVQYRQPENPPIAPATLADIGREVETIEYFKVETANTGPFIGQLLAEAGDEVDVLVGRAGYQMIDVFERGGVGVIPAASLFEAYLAIYQQYFEGDTDEAIRLHDRLLPILNHVSEASIPFEKAILAKRDIIETDYCRKPLHAVPDAPQEALLDRHFERVQPLLEQCHGMLDESTVAQD